MVATCGTGGLHVVETFDGRSVGGRGVCSRGYGSLHWRILAHNLRLRKKRRGYSV